MEIVIGRNNTALAYKGKLMSRELGPNWVPVTFSGFQSLSGEPFRGQHVWNFNGSTYYSYYEDQYILEPSTRTWILLGWAGAEGLYNYVDSIWINEFTGNPVYTVTTTSPRKSKSLISGVWEDVTWSGFDEPLLFTGNDVWKCKLSDGTVETYISKRYLSERDPAYMYKQVGAYTWQKMTLDKEYNAARFWYPHDWDETKITYYSDYENDRQEYVLNGEFHDITWNLPTQLSLPGTMWHTKKHDYCSPLGTTYPQLVRINGTNKWVIKEWTGCTPTSLDIWTDGVNTYYSTPSGNYMLVHEY